MSTNSRKAAAPSTIGIMKTTQCRPCQEEYSDWFVISVDVLQAVAPSDAVLPLAHHAASDGQS
ncbi:hypothetical protein FUT69_02625 [Xylella taiwanensis]|uniref:Uncharacterized protein n=1 Tax=Xylella taiwanensis TaxID=1444770 RepID=A0ABS8TV04_9GAMM|nr:hypothetical protein [Xylella taiwanensis]MCD8459501.1 hypothetical protein [Xylella taiwanensis]MCD8469110.1 hypothetical protein [Xylella taiwanensis]MCD8472329.1 hypothetical protein [Xylella taiwanensis]NBI36133.1 hypothetical protein [Xylella taiwanensis]UFN07209.1 hypothetical protein LPH42_02245 [Xylella taiwanensis]